MKKLILGLLLIAIIAVVIVKFTKKESSVVIPTVTSNPSAHKNISYNIEGQEILLKNGVAETNVAPDSPEKATTEYWGNEVRGDFNKDGREDVAFILTQSGEWTGVFYYLVAAINTPSGYKGTDGILLGDRIAPQTTEFKNGQIVVNYADRKPDEPFSADPSVGVSKYFKISGGELVAVSN